MATAGQETRLQERLQSGWQARQRGIELAVWSLLLLSPLLLLLACNLRQPRLDPAVAGIGDPVFDDFIATLYRDGGLDQPLLLMQELRLSPAAWDDLRQRHINDPRLYELRALIVVLPASADDPGFADYDRGKDDARQEALRELQERGLSSPSLGLAALELQYLDWLNEAEQEMELKRPKTGASQAQYDFFQLARHQHARQKHGAEQLAAYERLARQTPGEGAIWYSLALQDCEAGDWRAAREHLARGNAAGGCSAMRGCPLDSYYLACREGRAPADPLSGAVLAQLEVNAMRENYYKRRWPLEACIQHCRSSGDRALQAELYIALCRMARAPGCSSIESMFYLRQLDSMLAASRRMPQLTSSDPRLSRLDQDLGRINAAIRTFVQNSATQRYWNGGGGLLQNLQQQLNQRWQGFAGQGYEADLYRDSRDWNLLLAPGGSVYQQLLALEDFDWVSLSWRSNTHGAASRASTAPQPDGAASP